MAVPHARSRNPQGWVVTLPTRATMFMAAAVLFAGCGSSGGNNKPNPVPSSTSRPTTTTSTWSCQGLVDT
jgi:hypothetical protein